MKKIAGILLGLVVLTGCTGKNNELESALQLRTKLLNASVCKYEADISCDYGDQIQSFSLLCSSDKNGTTSFTVTKPASISGISGVIDGTNGKLSFDDTVLSFPLLTDERISPVCAPWILINGLRNGFIEAAGMEGSLLRMSIDDKYNNNALHIEIWFDDGKFPIQSEIIYKQRKIMSMNIRKFEIE